MFIYNIQIYVHIHICIYTHTCIYTYYICTQFHTRTHMRSYEHFIHMCPCIFTITKQCILRIAIRFILDFVTYVVFSCVAKGQGYMH